MWCSHLRMLTLLFCMDFHDVITACNQLTTLQQNKSTSQYKTLNTVAGIGFFAYKLCIKEPSSSVWLLVVTSTFMLRLRRALMLSLSNTKDYLHYHNYESCLPGNYDTACYCHYYCHVYHPLYTDTIQLHVAKPD
jgi:hypothetical protein